MLKTIAKLGGLRRAPGSQGQLKKIVKDAGITAYMTADEKSYFPFPTTMKVQWDGKI
jgi:linoleate 8R-lipoxygenase/9,12-octadecadienoate 8-hydroperoxide 8R-isomerase